MPADTPPPRHLLAHVTVSRPLAGLDEPVMASFLTALAPVNALAEQSGGFVWRLRSGESHGAVLAWDDGDVVVSLSVWESYEALHAFAYRSAHGAYVRRSARWFRPAAGPSTALWWVPAQDRPTVEEALARLRHLRTYGPSPQAFTPTRRVAAPGEPVVRPGRGRAAGRAGR